MLTFTVNSVAPSSMSIKISSPALIFEVIISSTELKKLKIVDAHKKIYTILNEEMKNIIHSLEIKIN